MEVGRDLLELDLALLRGRRRGEQDGRCRDETRYASDCFHRLPPGRRIISDFWYCGRAPLPRLRGRPGGGSHARMRKRRPPPPPPPPPAGGGEGYRPPTRRGA